MPKRGKINQLATGILGRRIDSAEDLLYDALLGVLYKCRRIPLGKSLVRLERGKDILRLLSIADDFIQDYRTSGLIPSGEYDDSIPF